MERTSSLVALIVAAALPVAALAQSTDSDTTAADIAANFQKQIAFKSGSNCPAGQKCRGLNRGLSVVPGKEDPAQLEARAQTYEAVPEPMQVNVRIEFDFDSAALRDDQKPKLAELCTAMRGAGVSLFQVVGHTDAVGSTDYNQQLSLLRAQEVKRHMIFDCGLTDTRLETIGMGEDALLDPDHPRADINRRVEFQALG